MIIGAIIILMLFLSLILTYDEKDALIEGVFGSIGVVIFRIIPVVVAVGSVCFALFFISSGGFR